MTTFGSYSYLNATLSWFIQRYELMTWLNLAVSRTDWVHSTGLANLEAEDPSEFNIVLMWKIRPVLPFIQITTYHICLCIAVKKQENTLEMASGTFHNSCNNLPGCKTLLGSSA